MIQNSTIIWQIHLESNLNSDHTLSRDDEQWNVTEITTYGNLTILSKISNPRWYSSHLVEYLKSWNWITSNLYSSDKNEKFFPSGMIPRGCHSLLPLLEGDGSFWNVFTCLYNPRQPTRSLHFYTASTPGQVGPLKKFPHWRKARRPSSKSISFRWLSGLVENDIKVPERGNLSPIKAPSLPRN